jgi:hypothetical protein
MCLNCACIYVYILYDYDLFHNLFHLTNLWIHECNEYLCMYVPC